MVKQCLLLGEFMPRIDKKSVQSSTSNKGEARKKNQSTKKTQGHKSPSVAKKEKLPTKKKEISYLRTRVREKFVCLQGTRQPKK